MSIPEGVTSFLRKRAAQPIAMTAKENLKLKRRQQAQRVTDAIAQTDEFVSEKNVCAECGNEKLVTKASPK